ncbi:MULTISPECIES: HK97 family phage prohead protease [Gallibacterium]|uniref:Peptidase U35 n=1 Tax=Gallibacterium anatis TaxID=750 RepID=A0A0A2XU47_9PAST|nr:MULTISPECIES: HK97 family phage prohead protease [Gallibacterium]KGQ33950.1 peptidase U35 [Gallibacterium anatis]WKT00959.1 HK97 family phage prohead protease [Gallibacterium salpingitidis]
MNKIKDLQFKAQAVKDDGFFAGYCNVFDVKDSYDEIVRKGAFLASINAWQSRGKMPPVLWNHDRNQPIGVWTTLKEDEHGLYGEGRLLINDVAKAKEVHALLMAGAIDGLSIGYRLNKWSYDEQNEILELLDIDLTEISVVTMPANEESRISVVKSALEKGSLPTLSEFEKALRDLGFSKSQAVTVASHGLRKLLNQGEPDNNHISNAITILKSINEE